MPLNCCSLQLYVSDKSVRSLTTADCTQGSILCLASSDHQTVPCNVRYVSLVNWQETQAATEAFIPQANAKFYHNVTRRKSMDLTNYIVK